MVRFGGALLKMNSSSEGTRGSVSSGLGDGAADRGGLAELRGGVVVAFGVDAWERVITTEGLAVGAFVSAGSAAGAFVSADSASAGAAISTDGITTLGGVEACASVLRAR